MTKNDVQRTFVMLRPMEGQSMRSGYLRVEARGGMRRLYFVVQGFGGAQDSAYAFLYGPEGTVQAGKLNIDERGQGGVVTDVGAYDYAHGQVALIVTRVGNEVVLCLAGSIGRGGWVDWELARASIAEALGIAPAAPEVQAPAPAALEEEETAAEEEPEPQIACTPAPADEPAQEPQQSPAQEKSVQEEETSMFDLPAQEEPAQRIEQELRTKLTPEQDPEMPLRLEQAYWPQILWPLRDLFARFAQVDAPDGSANRVFVRIPLSERDMAINHYLLAVEIEDGWVVGVGYYIPGEYDYEPPAGLTGYAWDESGYWKAWQYLNDQECEC